MKKTIISLRLEKAIEVKRAFIKLNIDQDTVEIKEFSVILNNWVKDGIPKSGKVKLPEINKKLVYQLSNPNNTIVKLTSNI